MREIVFDVETTGLSPHEDRIVEIACVELNDLLPTGREFHAYVNPQRQVPKAAERIHGLTYDFLKRKPTFAKVAPRFLDFVGDAPLVAHNATFDFGFVNAELRRLDIPQLANAMVDTLALARELHPGKKHSLDALCNRYKVDNSKREKHGALIDTRILAAVYLEMRGGRQMGLDISVAETSETESFSFAAAQRPVPLPSLLTEAEMQAHRQAWSGLSGWARYLP
jgi:DNA polymerase III subunit epsilon